MIAQAVRKTYARLFGPAPSGGLTVITPTYNRADFICETIDSVLSQGIRDLRYIVIDDGSRDDTAERIARFNTAIEYYRHDNIGETRTVNRALQLVESEFFTIVNSDDPLLPGSLAKMLKALSRRPDALAAYPDWVIIGPKSERRQEIRVGPFDRRALLLRNSVPIGPGACFRRSVLELVGYRNPLLRYSADLDYWYRIALAGEIVYVPEVLATHRVHPDSASVSDRGQLLADESFHLFYAYSQHPRLPEPDRRNGRIALVNGHFAALFVSTEPLRATRHLARGLLAQPVSMLKLLRAHGIADVVALFERLKSPRRRDVQGLFERAVGAATRREAVKPLLRGLFADPAGMLRHLEAFGADAAIARVRAMSA